MKEDDGGPRITVSIDRKIGLPDYGSASCGIILSRLRPDVTPEEIEELLATGRLAYDAMVEKLREEIRRFGRGMGFEPRACGHQERWGSGCAIVLVLFFGFKVESLNGGALQIFEWDKAAEIIKEYGVYDIKDLAGKACIVEIVGTSCLFVKAHRSA